VAGLTDEILMAYADGALDAAAAARVAAQLKTDPRAQARVAMFRATGRALSPLYDGVLREPVPEPLIEFVMSHGKEREARPAPAAGRAPARPRRRSRGLSLWAGFKERLIPEGAGWHLAAASAAALALGVSAGFFLSGEGADGASGPSLAALRQGKIVASGALHHVLESLPSNEERAAGSGQSATAVRAVLTFKTKEGGYCREYELAAPQGQFQGLACREADGHWAVEAHIAQGTAAAGTHVVGHGEVLDKIAEARMEGDAFGQSEEKAALKRGWQ
jgi:anti-sigma factor RsiW